MVQHMHALCLIGPIRRVSSMVPGILPGFLAIGSLSMGQTYIEHGNCIAI